jgi:probable rRNA maturation factor
MDDETAGQQITVQIAQLCAATEVTSEQIEKLVGFVCARFGVQKAIVGVAVVDDEHIRELNKQFLKHDYITDVLSFDLSEEIDSDEKCFEIVVNAELAARHAEKTQHNAQAEVALYITHGLLHQLGFDDQQDDKAEEMHRAEEEILRQFGFNFVYNQRGF